MKNPEPIAIIGIGCRFPGGVKNPESFWKLLCAGTDAVTEIPPDRWNLKTFFDEDPAKPGKMNIRNGGFLDQIDSFDAQFFGISPREASAIDPQQRLLMQVVWEALEDGGQVPENLANTGIGVFIGGFSMDYKLLSMSEYQRNLTGMHTATGISATLLSNRISYWFDFKGPSVTLDTACSSSLVATHLACQSIWRKESELALAGGANIIFKPEWTIATSKGGFLSPDGRCRSFDERANGYVRSEGVGVVVLKPLSKAVEDKDPVYAVILGTGTNQDGRTPGITFPSGEAQIKLIKEVCNNAGILPHQVQYVEAHGTGTAAGDPVEANAIGTVCGEGRSHENKCIIGSVKSNIGHTEAAAGVAGLIKAALSLYYGAIPPSIHFQNPNPKILFDELPIRVAKTLESFPANNGNPHIASVNSFGFGGTNAHVVMEEFRSQKTSEVLKTSEVSEVNAHVVMEEFRSQKTSEVLKTSEVSEVRSQESEIFLLPFSAKTPEALQEICRSHLDFLQNPNEDHSLSDICYSAARRRSHHSYRMALTAYSREEIQDKLNAFLTKENRRGLAEGKASEHSPKLVFIFSGMGPQWWGMGRQLLEQNAIFRDTIKECDRILRGFADWSLWDELTADEAHSRINETQIAQPSIFSVQAALSALWKSMGIYPSAIVGHSVGEIAAAHVAGVLSLEDALRVTFHRSRLQKRTAGQGKMLAVGLPISEAGKLLKDHSSLVSVGAVNSPDSVTLSGDTGRLEEIAGLLKHKDIFCMFLKVEVPYHSPLMEPLKKELAESLKGITPRTAVVPLYSTVTGKQIQGESMTPEYWAENMRNPVLFANAVNEIIKAGYTTFLEISSHPALGRSVSESLEKAKIQGAVLNSLRRKEDEQTEMLSSAAKLYTIGYPVKWEHFYPNGNFIRLPSYPWQEERYWTESEQGREDRLGKGIRQIRLADAVHPLLGSRMASPHPIWNSELSPQALDYIRDHQIQGSVVYPGAGYAEMALAAAKEIFGNAACTINDVRYKKALFLPDIENIPELQFIFDSDTRKFEVFSKTDEKRWSLHVTGEISPAPDMTRKTSEVFKTSEISVIRSRCHEEISVKECYDKFHEMGFEYGLKFQGIKQFWKGNNEAFAQIYLPESLENKDEGYFLHPVILDSCFQTFLGAAAFEGAAQTTYLPAKTEKFGYYARPDLNKNLWCHASLTAHNDAHLIGDIALFDDSGNLITEIRGFLCQSLETAVDKKSEWLYEFQWEKQGQLSVNSEQLSVNTEDQGVWLIFADKRDSGNQLRDLFKEHNQTTVLISPGDEYKQLSPNHFSIRQEDPEDMQNILETVFGVFPECQGVIYLSSEKKDLEGIQNLQGLNTVLHLVKSLAKFEWRTNPPKLCLVTERAQAVDSALPDSDYKALPRNQNLSLCQTPLWGLGRVIMNELPDFHTRMIDIGSSEDIHSLFKEILTDTNEDEIALRGGSRYVHRLVRSSPELVTRQSLITGSYGAEPRNQSKQVVSVKNQIYLEIADPVLSGQISLQIRKDRNNGFEIHFNGNNGTRISVLDEKILIKSVSKEIIHNDGTYLITGGLSGFGLAAAKWLGKQGARHLVLIGRSGISTPEAASAIEEMKQAGIHIKIAKADVTDAEQIAGVLAETAQTMPGLKGIIHSANVYDDAVLTDLTIERMQKVINPKAIGAWNLHQQTLNMQLDFFVMFSSITSVIGNPGQGNYAAANAFLDALAHYRHQMGLCALTINWGAVSDTGYAAKDADVAKHLDRIGVKGFSSKSAFGILKELLSPSSLAVQVAVADVDWQKWSKAHASGNSPRYSYLTGSGSEHIDKKEGKQENKSDFLNQLKNIPVDEREKHIQEI